MFVHTFLCGVRQSIVMRKFVLLVAVCIAGGVYAQEKKRYTNFEDTVFTMKDVIVKSEQVKKHKP